MKLISFRYENNVSYGLLQDNKISKLDYSNFNDILKDYYLGTLKVLSNDIDISFTVGLSENIVETIDADNYYKLNIGILEKITKTKRQWQTNWTLGIGF